MGGHCRDCRWWGHYLDPETHEREPVKETMGRTDHARVCGSPQLIAMDGENAPNFDGCIVDDGCGITDHGFHSLYTGPEFGCTSFSAGDNAIPNPPEAPLPLPMTCPRCEECCEYRDGVAVQCTRPSQHEGLHTAYVPLLGCSIIWPPPNSADSFVRVDDLASWLQVPPGLLDQNSAL